MQGRSDPNAALLDSQGLVRHLGEFGSVYAFPAEHHERLFAGETFADQFPSRRGPVEDREVSAAEAELFLETRRARAYVLRNNAPIAGRVVALLIIGDLASDLTIMLGG